jgi:tetratricopeptide (TPR) repeat protein
MQVESVTYIAAVDGTFALTLGLIAFLIETRSGKTSWTTHVASLLLILASILLKEIGALFIIGIVGYHIIWRSKRTVIYSLITSYMALSLLYLYLRLSVGHVFFTASRTQIVPIAGLDFIHRLINIPAIWWYYLVTYVYPARLAIDQQWIVSSVIDPQFYVPLIILLGSLIVLGKIMLDLKKTNAHLLRSAVFFFCWFTISLLLHLQLFPLDMTVADRFFYLPMIGLLGLLASIFSAKRWKIRDSARAPIIVVIALIYIGALSLRTIVRNRDWQDEITLYSHDSRVIDSFNIENNLGRAYFIRQNYQAALPHFRSSARELPTELNTYNIGATYEQLGDLSLAEANYTRALTLYKFPSDEHRIIALIITKKLAWIYLLTGRYTLATTFIRQQLTQYPSDGQLWESLAISEYLSNEKDKAIIDIQRAQTYMKHPNANSQYLFERIMRNEPIRIQ